MYTLLVRLILMGQESVNEFCGPLLGLVSCRVVVRTKELTVLTVTGCLFRAVRESGIRIGVNLRQHKRAGRCE